MVGLIAGILTLSSGGRVQYRRGALEFHGGFSRWFADTIGFSAMTLGHVIIGRDPWCLEFCRDHEQAHVRQVERWGAAFIPVYLLASLLAWCQGGHYYRDNWFERDARRPLSVTAVTGPAASPINPPTSTMLDQMVPGTQPRCTRFSTPSTTSHPASWFETS